MIDDKVLVTDNLTDNAISRVAFATENIIDILDSKKFKFCTLIIVRSKKGNNTFVHHNNDNL